MYEENKSGDMSIDTLANIYFTQDLYRQYRSDHKYYISNALFIIYAFNCKPINESIKRMHLLNVFLCNDKVKPKLCFKQQRVSFTLIRTFNNTNNATNRHFSVNILAHIFKTIGFTDGSNHRH